ncbi:hypothetical protein MMPV_004768 [Pyropia vietnamensis]
MAKRKGLSLEEKREKMVELLHETAEFFTLKELEKIAPKRKGIVFQSVKEVLQSLVDDGIVSSDKCGVQTVFWCLPSEAVQKKRARIAVLEEEVKSNTAALERLKSQLASMKAARTGRDLEGDNGRDAFLAQLATDETAVAALKKQVAEQAASDPERLRELATATTTAREAANRWTDNVDTLRRYVNDKFGMDTADFARQFGVPADMEYLEETAVPDDVQAKAPG